MLVRIKEFSCKGLLVNSEGTEEFVHFDDLSNYRSSNYMSSIVFLNLFLRII